MSDVVYIRILFPVNESEKYTLETNLKDDKVEEILSDYLRSVMGAGEDDNKPNVRDEYEIIINLNLEDDSFSVRSNTGNKGLRDGIVMDVCNRIKSSPIKHPNSPGSRFEIAKNSRG